MVTRSDIFCCRFLYFVMVALENPSSLLSISWEVQQPQVKQNTMAEDIIIPSFRINIVRKAEINWTKVSYTVFEVLIKTRLYTFNPNSFATLLINLAGCPIRLQSRTYLCTFTARAQWLEWLLY